VTTMLAARLHKIGEPMKLEHVPVPQPRPTDVLVAVKDCGVVPNLIIEDGPALATMAAAGTLDLSVFEHVRVPLSEVNRALDGSQFRDGGFTNVAIVP
jgi:hypothetical protein